MVSSYVAIVASTFIVPLTNVASKKDTSMWESASIVVGHYYTVNLILI